MQGEKSRENIARSGKPFSTIGAEVSLKKGTEPGDRKGKRSMLACHNRCKYSEETTRDLVKVKLAIKVMKLAERLIGWEVTVNW